MALNNNLSTNCDACEKKMNNREYFFHCSKNEDTSADYKEHVDYCCKCAAQHQQIITSPKFKNDKSDHSSNVYSLNEIKNDDDIIIQCNDDINKGIEFIQYHTMLNTHETAIKEWDSNTNRLQNISTQIQQDNNFQINDNEIVDDEKVNDANEQKQHDLYTLFVLTENIISQQSRRIHNMTNDEIIDELMMNGNKVSRQIKNNKTSCEDAQKTDISLNEQHASTKQKRIHFVESIENTVNQCNETIKHENNLLTQIKNQQHLIELLKEQREKLQSVSTKCISLIDAYHKFDENNSNYIDIIKKYFENKWNNFESKWWEWN
eukprot:450373_1